ncbi:hypothetical protein ACPV5S_01635 [Vibrio astriarenae]
MKFNQRTIVSLACAAVLSGCASTSSEDAIDTETNAVIQVGEYDRLMNRLQDAIKNDEEKDQLDWFAKNEYDKATRALREANSHFDEFKNDPTKMNSSSLFSRGTYRERMEAALDNFDTSFEKSQQIKQNTLRQMSKAFDNRQQLLTLEAANYYPQTMKRVEDQLKQVVDHSAEVKNIDPRRLESLETAQHALEVRTVKKMYVSEVKAELEKHKVARYNNDAPIIHARAGAAIQNVEVFIDESPRQIEQIENLVSTAEFALERAEQVTLQVRHLRTLPRENFERYILSQETRFNRINKALEGDDLRNLSLEEQSKEIAALVETKTKEHNENMSELALSMSQGTQELTKENQALKYNLEQTEQELAKLLEVKEELSAQLLATQTELANNLSQSEAEVVTEETDNALSNNSEETTEPAEISEDTTLVSEELDASESVNEEVENIQDSEVVEVATEANS